MSSNQFAPLDYAQTVQLSSTLNTFYEVGKCLVPGHSVKWFRFYQFCNNNIKITYFNMMNKIIVVIKLRYRDQATDTCRYVPRCKVDNDFV